MVDPCYYCGEPATSVDHARPQSLDSALRSMLPDDRARVVARQPSRDRVPACGNCNSVLGSRWFDTLDARRQHVKEYLRRKYAKVLAAPRWTTEEIGELGRTLRASVVRQQRLRDRVERRLRWPHDTREDDQLRRDAALNAALSFLPTDRLESSAPQPAGGARGTIDTHE